MASFEDRTQTGGLYAAQLNAGITEFTYDSDVFEFNSSIPSATSLTVAFEVKSVNSDGSFVDFISDDVQIAATKGNSESLVVSLKQPSTIDAKGVDSDGVTAMATIESSTRTLRSDTTGFTIDLDSVNEKLAAEGFKEIFATAGNYQVTLVMSGLRINERDGNDTSQAKQFSINTGDRMLTGVGFRGYVSILEP